MKNAFHTEAELFHAVQQSDSLQGLHCSANWQIWTDSEVEGLFGRPDYLIAYFRTDTCGRRQIRSVAFELKLADWKRALIQAFRYAAFAHYAYVLLDHFHVGRALRSIDRFRKANIGLLSFSRSGELKVHHRPNCRTPYAPGLRDKLQRMVPSPM